MGGMNVNDEDKKKMQHELCNLMNNYKEMAKKVGASSLVDHMLTSMNLTYSVEVIVMPLLPKFRVPYMDLYNRAKDPLEHLGTFKAYMTLHRFSREIACKAFSLTLKGAM